MVKSYKEDRKKVPSLLAQYNGDESKVAKKLHRSLRFVRAWGKKSLGRKGFGNATGAGRPRILSGPAKARAKQIALGRVPKHVKFIAAKLRDENYTEKLVSASTVVRSLKSGSASLSCRPDVRRQKLTCLEMAKRYNWAKAHKNIDWKNVMVTDSHVFVCGGKTYHRRYWQRPGKPRTKYTAPHPMQIHAYAGATFAGVAQLAFVTGTTGQIRKTRGVNAKEYQKVIRTLFVPEGERLFGGREYHLYQDGAPPHTAKSTKSLWTQYNKKIQLIQGPPKSPDINWIEQLWNATDNSLSGRSFKNMKSFKAAVTAAWSEISTDLCKKHVKSIPRRLKKLINLKGGHIERTIYS